MPRAAARFTQVDIARALRAIEQTGLTMEVVLDTDGNIIIRPCPEGRETEKTVDFEESYCL